VSPVPPAGGGTASLVLFDPSGTAHSGNAIDGLATAAVAAGIAVTVHAPEQPHVPGDEAAWVPTEVGPVLGDRTTRRAHRAALARALADAGAGGVVCDLGLGRTLHSRGKAIRSGAGTVFVCHQTNAIDPGRTREGRRLTARSRRLLKTIGETGAQIVTHTDIARERVTEYVPAAQVHCLGWPVTHRDAPSLGPAWRPEPDGVTVLFAGSARRAKGVDLLVRAAPLVQGFDRVVVPGRIPAPLRRELDVTDPRVELWERWLDADEYRAAFARASLVALPYREAYLDHGTYSSVLGEAMAYGRPLLVSRALAHLLPPGYQGALVADTESPEALAAGLTQALAELDRLEAAAMDAGRAHVGAAHSYEGYVEGIMRIAGQGG
jgi:glycosyltransferase involved in cell wall biosynthesis